MDLSIISQRFLFIFYAVGLSSYNPSSKSTSSQCQRLPAVILFLFIISTIIFAFSVQYFQYLCQGTFGNLTAFLFITTECTTCTAIICHSFLYKCKTTNLWHKYNTIEKLYNLQHRTSMCFEKFNRNYLRDVGIIFFIHITQIAVKIQLHFGVNDVIINCTVSALLTVVLASNCHILFYVKLLVHILQHINERFRRTNDIQMFRFASWNHHYFITKFKHFKHIICCGIYRKRLIDNSDGF